MFQAKFLLTGFKARCEIMNRSRSTLLQMSGVGEQLGLAGCPRGSVYGSDVGGRELSAKNE